MAKANVKNEDHGDGRDYINLQKAVDKAANNAEKSDSDKEKLDPDNRRSDYVKKSGRTSH